MCNGCWSVAINLGVGMVIHLAVGGLDPDGQALGSR